MDGGRGKAIGRYANDVVSSQALHLRGHIPGYNLVRWFVCIYWIASVNVDYLE